MGRASMPSSVSSWRNVNCVGPNVKVFGFSTSIAWVVGVSGREDTTRILKPRGGPANPSTPMCLGAGTRLPYFVTLTVRKASHQCRSVELLSNRRSVAVELSLGGMLLRRLTMPSPTQGWVFLCNDNTEEDCFRRCLVGSPEKYLPRFATLRAGDPILLYNYEAGRPVGHFTASSENE